MRGLTDIHDEAYGQFERLLREAFEAGRSVGREESRTEFRRKLNGLLVGDETTDGAPSTGGGEVGLTKSVGAVGPDVQPVEDNGKRATPGSVKPTISKLVLDEPGLSVGDIQKRTGFKHNSVRGTLWTLSATDKVIERRGDGWFPVAKRDEAAGTNPEERMPTASGGEVLLDNLDLLSSDRGPQAAER